MGVKVKVDLDTKKIEKMVKEEAKKQLRNDTFEVPCPHCSNTVTVPAGESLCPICNNGINLNLNFKF